MNPTGRLLSAIPACGISWHAKSCWRHCFIDNRRPGDMGDQYGLDAAVDVTMVDASAADRQSEEGDEIDERANELLCTLR